MHAYPKNVLRIMYPQMSRLIQIIAYHFERRHEGGTRKTAVRNWISEFRRVDKASGFSKALKQVGGSGYRQA